MRTRFASALASLVIATLAAADPGPPPAGYQLQRVSDAVPAASLANISQLAFRPGDGSHLYAARTFSNVVTRYDYDAVTGLLSNPVNVTNTLPMPHGIAFRGADLYVTLKQTLDSRIARLRDLDQNGFFEERVDFVRGIPTRDHAPNQLQIAGATLYVGIGVQKNAGRPECETVYNGVVARIADLDQIDYAGGGNYLATAAEFVNPSPADGMLRRYAYGFRNPFGLRLDALGRVWVSDNGASFCDDCSSCANLPIDTPDFLYRDVPQGAKAEFPPSGQPGGGSATIARFATLETHAAATGFAWIANGPDAGHLLVAEFGATEPGVPAGRDIVKVDAGTGQVSPFITGFVGPTDILPDALGRLLIADLAAPAIYLLSPPGVTAVAPGSALTPATGVRIEHVAPNPASGAVSIEYWLGVDSPVTVRIVDAAGRQVALLDSGPRTRGRRTLVWRPLEDARTGLYFCRIETNAGTAARAFVRTR